MGKKSQQAKPESQAILQSLFSGENPFLRRPDASPNPPPPSHEDSVDAKNSKRNKPNPNPNPSSAPSSSDKRKKKRKREDLEAEYERRRPEVVPEVVGDGEVGGRAVAVGTKRKAGDLIEGQSAVPEESFDDETKLVRTVFVGNLPLKTKRKGLMKEFGEFGEIESIRIRSVPLADGKTPRKGAIIQGKLNDAIDSVHAYIVFKDEESAKASLSLNMAEFGGHHIRVDMACPPRKKLRGEGPLYDRKRTIFVGNLPFDVKDEEIYQLFCGIDKMDTSIEAVRVVRDPNTSLGKGIAYVLFKSRDAANTIVKRRDLKIRDRALRVYHVNKSSENTTPSKRKASGAKSELPRKKFAESSGEMSGNADQPKARAPILPYQGLRSSKSGAVKKSYTGTSPHLDKQGSNKSKRGAVKDKKIQTTKRPSVAARKAKQLAKKRKQETPSSGNTHRNKKLRSS